MIVVDGERIAQNESAIRVVNERVEAGQWPNEPARSIAFLCECARLGCNVRLAMTVVEYERVRANPRRFILAPGHEIAGVDEVVERHDGYVVAEKVGAAGRGASELDPRD
jgi:hypothetical protein